MNEKLKNETKTFFENMVCIIGMAHIAFQMYFDSTESTWGLTYAI